MKITITNDNIRKFYELQDRIGTTELHNDIFAAVVLNEATGEVTVDKIIPETPVPSGSTVLLRSDHDDAASIRDGLNVPDGMDLDDFFDTMPKEELEEFLSDMGELLSEYANSEWLAS